MPDRLTPAATAVLQTADNIWVSAASAYEIEYKRLRDLELRRLPEDLSDGVRRLRAEWLPLTAEHCTVAGRLHKDHRDPWDRLIIAQALFMGSPVVTNDPWFAPYGVTVIW